MALISKIFKASLLLSASLCLLPQFANAQVSVKVKSDAELKLAKDSPFRDPDIIYLEANELINDQKNDVITAIGQVDGRYQDRTIRADKVIYYLKTGQVYAEGNVILINANGSSQYADKLELSDSLEAGTATNFLARFPTGGQLASAFAARQTKDGVELYNAYYTACKACVKNGKTKKPSWQLKARKVTQDKKTKSIRYKDAVFEFKGIPLFYTPYLAHPDPSVNRASGWLVPFGGVSGNKGVNIRTPYYFALSPSSELTLTPHIYAKVNPLLEAQYRKKFFSGEINLEGSATYSNFFDNKGKNFDPLDFFSDEDESLRSNKWRSHLFINGQFDINKNWKWGFEAGYATDDNYLDRYDLDEIRPDFGLYQADSRRLMQQIFVVGQGKNYRYSASAFGNVSLRSSLLRTPANPHRIYSYQENDSTLPVVAPKIEITKYFKDPVVGGRLKFNADTTVLKRQLGTDYTRGTAALEWYKNWIAPAGIEVKPFAQARIDYFNLKADGAQSKNFSRVLGKVGVDIRWPFLKVGEKVNWILEPRVQITQNIGDGKNASFNGITGDNTNVVLAQDGLDIDFDQTLLWSTNKSTGYDIWQEGFRADVGASLIADWGSVNRAQIFLGQSYYSGTDKHAFKPNSGIGEDKSDIVGMFELTLGNHFSTKTRVRYDDDKNAFRRLDTGFSIYNKYMSTYWRYYRLDSATAPTLANSATKRAPTEEVSGGITLNLIDNWSTRYQIYRDIDQGVTRRQTLSLIYNDDCTRIELIYKRDNNNLGLLENSDSFGIRVSLLSLGGFGSDPRTRQQRQGLR
ncbi:MAG: LPS assembly protein LptD [Robiginitomaculum sp.]